MGYGSLVSLVFHNLPSLYPSSFYRNDFSYLLLITHDLQGGVLHLEIVTRVWCVQCRDVRFCEIL